jgi:hypothetical protein
VESRSNPPKNILSSLPDGQTCTNYKHSKKYKLFVGLSIPLTPIIHHQHHRLCVCVCVCVWCWHFFVYESVTPVKSVQLWQLYRFFLPFSGSQLTRLNVVIRIIANKEREKEEMYGNSLLLLIRCRGSVRGPLFCLYITKARQSLNRNDANVASHPITSKSLARLYM